MIHGEVRHNALELSSIVDVSRAIRERLRQPQVIDDDGVGCEQCLDRLPIVVARRPPVGTTDVHLLRERRAFTRDIPLVEFVEGTLQVVLVEADETNLDTFLVELVKTQERYDEITIRHASRRLGL